MRIEQFTLSNFKSFDSSSQRVYKTSEINLIFGENNSGKSNILKFLKLIFCLKKITNTIEVEDSVIEKNTFDNFFTGFIEDEAYIFHKNNRTVNIVFDFHIKIGNEELKAAGLDFINDLQEEYFVTERDYSMLRFQGELKNLDYTNSEIILNSSKLNTIDIFSQDNGIEHYFESGKDEPKLRGNKKAFIQLLSFLNDLAVYIDNDRFFKREKYNRNLKDLNPHNFKNWLYSLSTDELKYDKYLDLLNFIRENSIDSLRLLKELDISFALNDKDDLELLIYNGSERLPIDSYGTGVTQIFYILTKVFFTSSKILLVEELELNLSPKTQRELFDILRRLIEQGVINQVFFTSHSSYFNFRNDFSLFRVGINENGVSDIEKIEPKAKNPFFEHSRID